MDKGALLSAFVQYLVPVLATALASGLSWLLAQAGLWLKAKASTSKTAAALGQLAFLAEIVVADIEAHERPLLKELTSDGKLSKEDGQRLLELAVTRLKTLAKERGFDEAKRLLETFSPAVESLLSGLIEKAVAGLPKASPEPVAVPVATEETALARP